MHYLVARPRTAGERAVPRLVVRGGVSGHVLYESGRSLREDDTVMEWDEAHGSLILQSDVLLSGDAEVACSFAPPHPPASEHCHACNECTV